MTTVTKEFKWDCAHLLDGHLGLCQNLHGHTYKMEVTAILKDSDKNVLSKDDSVECEGMVADFKDLKTCVEGLIVDKLDHALVFNTTTHDLFEQALYQLTQKHHKKVYEVAYRPTAENMARDFFHKINDYAIRHHDWHVHSIKIWETPTSYAEYREV